MPIGVNRYDPQASPFHLSESLARIMQARYQAAQAREQEEKNPFVAQDMKSQINSRDILSMLNKQKYDFPGLQGSSVAQDLAIGDIMKGRGQQPDELLRKNIESEIKARESLANYRGMGGGGRGGVSAQQQALLQQQLIKDNPGFTEEQAYEAAGNLLQGIPTLNDGTPYQAGGLATVTAQKIASSSQPAALVTSQTRAAQSEAEIPVVDKYINEGVNKTGYGDTIFGYSPKMMGDISKTNDDAAQERLAKYAVSKILSMDKAALGLKVAGIESGVTTINEAMENAGQQIKDVSFLKTAKSRELALKIYRQALTEMLNARKSVSVLNAGLAGSITQNLNGAQQQATQRNPSEMTTDEIKRELGI